MNRRINPWVLAGIAVGGVAIVASGVVVAVKLLNNKKKKITEKEVSSCPDLTEEQLEKILPTPENLKQIAEEKDAGSMESTVENVVLES